MLILIYFYVPSFEIPADIFMSLFVFDEPLFIVNITTLSGGFLVTYWLAREQQMLCDVSSLFSADSIQNPRN